MSHKKMEKNNQKAADENLPATEPQPEARETVDKAAESEDVSVKTEASEEKTVDPAKEIEDLKKQISDGNDRYIRLMAEFDNYKKRISREYERQVDSANEKLMVEMIDVRENFERALKAEISKDDISAIVDGMKLIFSKFDGVLSRNGLEAFAVAGEPFDPNLHNALMNTPKDDIPADHIADIFERGYKLKSKVVKHAKVIVSSGAPAQGENNDKKESK